MTGGGSWPPGQDAAASRGDRSKTTVNRTLFEGTYRVFRVIGEGGMGTVYEAQQLRLNKRVAIKVMSRESSDSPRATFPI